MSKQIHAPMSDIDAENPRFLRRSTYEGPIPRPFDVWSEAGACWCSACFSDVPDVVCFGTGERHAGLCYACIDKIHAERSTEPECLATKEEP